MWEVQHMLPLSKNKKERNDDDDDDNDEASRGVEAADYSLTGHCCCWSMLLPALMFSPLYLYTHTFSLYLSICYCVYKAPIVVFVYSLSQVYSPLLTLALSPRIVHCFTRRQHAAAAVYCTHLYNNNNWYNVHWHQNQIVDRSIIKWNVLFKY